MSIGVSIFLTKPNASIKELISIVHRMLPLCLWNELVARLYVAIKAFTKLASRKTYEKINLAMFLRHGLHIGTFNVLL